MSDQPKYQVSFPGQFSATQIAVGEGNTLHQTVSPTVRERLDDAELAELEGRLRELRESVAALCDADRRAEALQHVDELQAATLAADEPEPGRMARVYRWFLDNAPALAESVSTLLLGPLVGKLIGGGTGAMIAALDTGHPKSEGSDAGAS